MTKEKLLLQKGIESISKQNDIQEIKIRNQYQEIKASNLLSHSSNQKGRKSTRRGCWTQEDDRSAISQFKGIKLQLDLFANAEAALVVTETMFAPSGLYKLLDWTGSASPVTRQVAMKCNLYVHFLMDL